MGNGRAVGVQRTGRNLLGLFLRRLRLKGGHTRRKVSVTSTDAPHPQTRRIHRRAASTALSTCRTLLFFRRRMGSVASMGVCCARRAPVD